MDIKANCRFFLGSKPCVWHKKNGVECESCNYYDMFSENILIIKLEAMGDVLRSTCLIPAIKNKFPFSRITWITKRDSMDMLLLNNEIDEVWNCDDLQALQILHIQTWDYVYNLDNSKISAAMASGAKSQNKYGFILSEKGIITPTNSAAEGWLELAVSDRKKRENTKSYQEIMYNICGLSGQIMRPSLVIPRFKIKLARNLYKSLFSRIDGKFLIGINTGSGSRWPKKMLDTEGIVDITERLLNADKRYCIVLLGGPNEEEKNKRIAKRIQSSRFINMGCKYDVIQFSAIISQCDAILCGDTLALHIASALDVRSVVVFGPTSSNEIYTYNGLIEPIIANVDCLCCYGDCNKKDNCMTLISKIQILEKVKKQLDRKHND